MNAAHSLVCVVSLALVCCAGDASRDRSRPAENKSISQRLNESNGFKQDEAGNWVPKSDKRSSFENVGTSPYFKGTQEKKNFKTGEYQRKSWWGNKDYQVKSYEGNTDGSRFQKTARQQGISARETSATLDLPGDYATGAFATGSAREAKKKEITRVTDAETEAQRNVYQAPEVINWRQQRPISREQSRSLLGR